MKKIKEKAATADEFIEQMNAKYPNCKGKENLKGIVSNLYN